MLKPPLAVGTVWPVVQAVWAERGGQQRWIEKGGALRLHQHRYLSYVAVTVFIFVPAKPFVFVIEQ